MSFITSSAIFSRRMNEQCYRFISKGGRYCKESLLEVLKTDKLGKSLHFYQFTLPFLRGPFEIKNQAAPMFRD